MEQLASAEATPPRIAYLSRIPFGRCPLCSSERIATLLTADCSRHPLYRPELDPHMAWMRCSRCEHVFTSGYFGPELSVVVFSRTQDVQTVGANFEQWRHISARIIERVIPHAAAGRWLDVGFGNGSLLCTAEEWGFEPVGLDLRAENVAAVRALGIEAHRKNLVDYDDGARFAVISMADVLEHMPFPKRALTAAYRLLEPSGVLFVSMPHYGCAAWRQLDAANSNPYWGELEHFHNFSRKRLCALLGECGFDFLRYGISERYRVCMELIVRRRPNEKDADR